MSEDRTAPRFESLAEWRVDFLEAAAANSRRTPPWRRPFVIGGVALALAASGGIAVAEIIDSGNPAPLQVSETVGYVNLETGEPITCPGGEPLTYSPARLPATDTGATCSDGSVPEVFLEQQQALDAWLLSHPSETPLVEAPTFSYAIPEEE